jgi:hypothetical protein
VTFREPTSRIRTPGLLKLLDKYDNHFEWDTNSGSATIWPNFEKEKARAASSRSFPFSSGFVYAALSPTAKLSIKPLIALNFADTVSVSA